MTLKSIWEVLQMLVWLFFPKAPASPPALCWPVGGLVVGCPSADCSCLVVHLFLISFSSYFLPACEHLKELLLDFPGQDLGPPFLGEHFGDESVAHWWWSLSYLLLNNSWPVLSLSSKLLTPGNSKPLSAFLQHQAAQSFSRKVHKKVPCQLEPQIKEH